jgi:hypothetical protein
MAEGHNKPGAADDQRAGSGDVGVSEQAGAMTAKSRTTTNQRAMLR